MVKLSVFAFLEKNWEFLEVQYWEFPFERIQAIQAKGRTQMTMTEKLKGKGRRQRISKTACLLSDTKMRIDLWKRETVAVSWN